MKIGRRVKNRIGDDRGISLVELIVVISIMSVMIGVLSLGVSMMFSRDANYVAVRIDDALAETRTLAMSRNGDFTCSIHIDNVNPRASFPEGSYVQIMQSVGGATATEYKRVLLDKNVTIEVDGDGAEVTDNPVVFEFSKSKGNLSTVNGSESISDVYTITVTSTRGTSRTKEVTLISTTGRHYTEK